MNISKPYMFYIFYILYEFAVVVSKFQSGANKKSLAQVFFSKIHT